MKTKIISLILPLVISVSLVQAQETKRFFFEKDLITTGIYYYPEHWDENQWERDIKQISTLGFEFIHLAEFAWDRMEPQEGQFNFEWLDRVISLAGKYNLKVVLCTPSATPPAWLGIEHPEIYFMNSSYIRAEHGTRANGSLSNSTFRRYVAIIDAKMAEHFGKNPEIIGWQIDNEPEAKADYSPSAQEAFRKWLKTKYTTIDKLNDSWGTSFWSQMYNNFEQIKIPNADLVGWWGSNPHALLDFKEFSADVQADFIDYQAEILRKYISTSQFVTTNYLGKVAGTDPYRVKLLDFPTFTAYPNGGQHNIGDQGFRLGNSRLLAFANAFYRNINGTYGIMELQPGPVNWGSVNPILMPGALHMWLWQSFGAGSSLACSYRFRQILYGAEQYHSGIMKTDGITPSEGGMEYQQFISEIKELRKLYQPNSKIPDKLNNRKTAILWNIENYWTIDRQKQTQQWDAWGYAGKYLEILNAFGAPVDIVNGKADLSTYKFVVVPAYELADSALVQKWTNYVTNGGNLVITCRTATKDRQGHFWEAETAAPISGLIGAHITNTDMLPPDVQGKINYRSSIYYWNSWADLLNPDNGTEVLATYADQIYAGMASVVRHYIGQGSVTYIGVDTDDSKLEKAILHELYVQRGAKPENYPPGIFVYWRDGFYVAVNFSSDNFTVDIPTKANIIVGQKEMKPAGVLVWSE